MPPTKVFDMGKNLGPGEPAFSVLEDQPLLTCSPTLGGSHQPIVRPTDPPSYVCYRCGVLLEPATAQQPEWRPKYG